MMPRAIVTAVREGMFGYVRGRAWQAWMLSWISLELQVVQELVRMQVLGVGLLVNEKNKKKMSCEPLIAVNILLPDE